MSDQDNRRADRDSLFLLAAVKVDGSEEEHRVKIRNLSLTGLMAEGDARVRPGSRIEIDIRNIGWMAGSVAWVVDNRLG